MCKLGLLKTKELSLIICIVVYCFVFYVVLCLVCFLRVVWLFCFGYGTDEVMMY